MIEEFYFRFFRWRWFRKNKKWKKTRQKFKAMEKAWEKAKGGRS